VCAETVQRLTVRILLGKRSGGGGGQGDGSVRDGAAARSDLVRERLLHVEITDEADPYFLFTLDVGEEDFHELKRDQALLVDFDTFPRKFIELLDRCASGDPGISTNGAAQPPSSEAPSSRDSSPLFVARLETDGGAVPSKGGASSKWAALSIVETNPFKQLTHLALQFRAGNDASVKAYLAGRLQQVLGDKARLAAALNDTEVAFDEERSARAAASDELSTIRRTHDTELRELRSQHAAELATRREESALEKEETISRLEGAKTEQHRALEEAMAALRARLDESEKLGQELTASKYLNEAQLRDASAKLAAVESCNTEMQTELEELRSALQASEARKFHLESEAQASGLKVCALEQKVLDKEEIMRQSGELATAAEHAKRHLEQNLERYKATAGALQDKLKQSVMEINKGNDVIARLQHDVKILRDKSKAKSDVIREQERRMSEERRSAGEVETERHAVSLANDRLQEKNVRLRAELDDARIKLGESSALLESNQQTIAWLNKELNASVGTVAFSASKDILSTPRDRNAHIEGGIQEGRKLTSAEVQRFGDEYGKSVDSQWQATVSSRLCDPVDLSGALYSYGPGPATVSPPMHDGLRDFPLSGHASMYSANAAKFLEQKETAVYRSSGDLHEVSPLA
jgi:spindle assembly abnormal protein 6